MATTALNVNIDDDEELRVTTRKRDKWLIPFTPIGNKTMNENTLDALDVICSFSPAELYALKQVKDKINTEHEVRITKKGYTSANQQKLVKGLKGLIERGLIYRLRREHYIVNPFFLVPRVDRQAALILRWEKETRHA